MDDFRIQGEIVEKDLTQKAKFKKIFRNYGVPRFKPNQNPTLSRKPIPIIEEPAVIEDENPRPRFLSRTPNMKSLPCLKLSTSKA
jgi:hypothetical protein